MGKQCVADVREAHLPCATEGLLCKWQLSSGESYEEIDVSKAFLCLIVPQPPLAAFVILVIDYRLSESIHLVFASPLETGQLSVLLFV